MRKRWQCHDKDCHKSFETFEELEAHHKEVDKINAYMQQVINIINKRKGNK